ncbi:MAG: alpha/beta hydrolase [Acidimicrobiales bacterium]|nr:alpha/beta hydrolase [Acidimicrobiales bacterium]MCB9372203.1 alpha/beta hydrolase [Microthrixaceae bacterium]
MDRTTHDTGTEADGGIEGPPLPLGRRVDLPGRGRTFVREVPGPPGAPTLLLLHGWIASAGLNWFQVYEALGRHFRIVAPDLRGHGRGIRALRRFRLADCADDAAALIDELDVGPVIAVGYSMGGPVSQLLWRRHPDQVRGLVLCATGHSFVKGGRERYVFTSTMAALAATTRLGQLAAHLPSRQVQRLMPIRQDRARPGSLQRWAAAEMRRHDPRVLLEAGHAIGNYDAGRWIGEIDVPTTVLVTTEDRAIQPETQLAMARAIKGSDIHLTRAGHVLCARPEFAPPLAAACASVAERV